DGDALQQPVLEHHLAAAATLFGRLEDKRHPAVEIAGLGEVLRRPEEHGGVPVVAAGMHLARDHGGIWLARFFRHRQRVHVGPQTDGTPTPVAAAVDDADDTIGGEPGDHLVAPEFLQLLRHDCAGPNGIEQYLRMRMEIAPPSGDLLVKFGNAIDDRHVRSDATDRDVTMSLPQPMASTAALPQHPVPIKVRAVEPNSPTPPCPLR